jgi:hypothetical protein
MPAALDPDRSQRLVEDADWLCATHGEQLAHQGWTDLDVFGVSTRRHGGEALLDRLDGSRSLRLDGKSRAAWAGRTPQ